MDILAICQKLQILWHFEILTWESMGKPKMWDILRMADHRAKWTKIWDSGYCAHMEVTFEFGLGSFGTLGKISNFTIFKTLVFSKFLSDFIQTLYKVS